MKLFANIVWLLRYVATYFSNKKQQEIGAKKERQKGRETIKDIRSTLDAPYDGKSVPDDEIIRHDSKE